MIRKLMEIFGIFQHKVERTPHFARVSEVRHMSRLQACGPVIPGIPQLAGVDPARYASGRYGDQVRYGDGILFLFGRAHALATPKGGGPCPLGTLYYFVVGHLDSRLH